MIRASNESCTVRLPLQSCLLHSDSGPSVCRIISKPYQYPYRTSCISLLFYPYHESSFRYKRPCLPFTFFGLFGHSEGNPRDLIDHDLALTLASALALGTRFGLDDSGLGGSKRRLLYIKLPIQC